MREVFLHEAPCPHCGQPIRIIGEMPDPVTLRDVLRALWSDLKKLPARFRRSRKPAKPR